LRIKSVLEAITGSVQRSFGHPITLAFVGPRRTSGRCPKPNRFRSR